MRTSWHDLIYTVQIGGCFSSTYNMIHLNDRIQEILEIMQKQLEISEVKSYLVQVSNRN